jgi:hypothetical protein
MTADVVDLHLHRLVRAAARDAADIDEDERYRIATEKRRATITRIPARTVSFASNHCLEPYIGPQLLR